MSHPQPPQPALCCPVCRAALHAVDNQLQCDQKHSFDRARQGYWNLLLAHKKRSKDPGDNAAMVQARHEFLEQGYYQPLSDAVNKLACEQLKDIHNPQLLDMGCGEGYYSDRLQRALSTAGLKPSFSALDISKHAVKAACHRNRDIHWLVASGADMPLTDGSQDLLTVLFSRLMPEPFARLLRPGGKLLLAWPGPDHLLELRQMIYDQVRPSNFQPAEQLAEYFSLIDQQQVHYPFTLTRRQDIEALLGMTPHSQRMQANKREALLSLDSLPLTLDVRLGLFERR
ncbi:putative RNA methyltransferase [Marinobacterium arenosum]|uniref:putative RNA methyltransferase n=1 Tax=Marinobacterium arenosum TaxID=2862496 RepID=UPI001C93F16E|nr:methyltransferase domain-containing protein [Marinobacterium arenosum]MBY4678033.1 methyltransferase domain-containing protein [Marinobacterium arenosum]